MSNWDKMKRTAYDKGVVVGKVQERKRIVDDLRKESESDEIIAKVGWAYREAADYIDKGD